MSCQLRRMEIQKSGLTAMPSNAVDGMQYLREGAIVSFASSPPILRSQRNLTSWSSALLLLATLLHRLLRDGVILIPRRFSLCHLDVPSRSRAGSIRSGPLVVVVS